MTCPGCDRAHEPNTMPVYYLGCDGCEARSLLRYEPVQKALAAKQKTPEYRQLLRQFFGERWEVGHKLVKEWATKLSEGTQSESR